MKKIDKCITKRALSLLVAVTFWGSVMLPNGLAQSVSVKATEKQVESQSYVPGQLLVTYDTKHAFEDIESEIEKSNHVDEISCLGVLEAGTSDSEETALISVDETIDMKQAIAEIKKCKDVLHVQPNYIYKTAAISKSDWNAATKSYKELSETKTNAGAVNGKKVTVAVLDSRIDVADSAIAPYIDCENAYNAIEGGNEFGTDDASHGTGVSKTIINSAKDAMDKVGVDYDIEILPVQTCKVDYTTDAYMIEACIYVKNMIITGRCPDLHIVNMSVSGTPDYANDKTLQESIENLRDYGVITVCAAGNTGTSEDITPADFSNTIAVCSLDEQGNLNESSSWGPYKSIGAISSSTSGASAVVAGAASVLYALDPTLTAEEATNALVSKETTIPIATSTTISKQRMESMDGIYQLSIAKAAASVKKTLVDKPVVLEQYIYDGEEKSPLLESDYYTVSGQVSATDAGDYQLCVSLKDGCVWSDYSRDDIYLDWSIARKEIAEPDIQNYILADADDAGVMLEDGEGYLLSGDIAAPSKGEYYVTATLKDNYIWQDGTTDDKQYSYRVTNPKEIALPQAKNWTYSGEENVGIVAGEGYTLSCADTNVRITSKGAVATEAGTYSVIIAPKDGYRWEDETDETANASKTITFTIDTKKILVPDELERKYTGQTIMLVDEEVDFTVAGQGSAVSEGEYEAILALNDTKNTVWVDGSIAEKEISWSIVPDIIYEVNSGKAYINQWKGSKTDIVIPETIDGYDLFGINDYAFAAYFNKVTSVVFPKNMWMIGNDAFAYCYDLKKISFSEEGVSHLNWLGYSVFFECRNLETVELPAGVYGSHITLEKAMFGNCKSLTEITIPVRFWKLADSAFQGCSALESVTLESDNASVVTIGNQCFAKCYRMKSITLPDNVQMIGDQCFFQCKALEEFTVPQKVINLGKGCFTSCESLKKVTFDNDANLGFTSINGYTFYECTSLTDIHIPDGVSLIGEYAFGKCEKLTTLNIPNSLSMVEEGCFSYTSSLEKYNIASDHETFFVGQGGELYKKEMGQDTFISYPAASKATSFTLPKQCYAVMPYAFSGSENLKELIIPEGIRQEAFMTYCFEGMSDEAVIKAPTKQIGELILQSCIGKDSKTKVEYPGKATVPDSGKEDVKPTPTPDSDTADKPSDTGSAGGTTVTPSVDVGNKDDKVSQMKAGKAVEDDKASGRYVVSDAAVKEVAFDAPADSKAKTIKISSSVIFDGQSYKVTEIKENAFKNNRVVTKITLPASIKTIGKNAFSGCKKLSSLTIPKNVKKIGANAFNGCSKLKIFSIKSTKLTDQTVAKNAFKGLSKKTVIKVPKKKLKVYKKLFKKKGFKGKVKSI